jgi:hypothetical protein
VVFGYALFKYQQSAALEGAAPDTPMLPPESPPAPPATPEAF